MISAALQVLWHDLFLTVGNLTETTQRIALNGKYLRVS
jgi:hypothetical protein